MLDAVSTTGSRGRPRQPELDQRILGAARAVLTRGGYTELTMEAVAAVAGVGKQSLYRRWPRRPLLVFDAVFGGGEQAAVMLPDTGSLGEDLAAVVVAAQAVYSDEDSAALLRGLLSDCLAEPELLEQFRRRLVRPRLDALATVISRAADRGEVSPGISAENVAEILGGSMLAHYIIYGGDVDGSDGDRFGVQLAQIITRGVR
jgi:AcrR family transcriptional regulator